MVPAFATLGSEELHVPPLVDEDRLTTFPTHTVEAPVMLPGNANTDRYLVLLHPFERIYETFTPPPVTPVIFPLNESIVATLGEPEFHTPPLVPHVNVSDTPTHKEDSPIIGPGEEFTVTARIEKQPLAAV